MLEQGNDVGSTSVPKTFGNSFTQGRVKIFERIRGHAEQCRKTFENRKELATEDMECVAGLCEALENAFSFGIRQQELNFVATAASLFQNMHDIVTGTLGPFNSETTFWDFCAVHLTNHERERFENLKKVWTKTGRGRAFLRATLNEQTLCRYLLTFLDDKETLMQYYAPWSIFLDDEMCKDLTSILNSLDSILFALAVDSIDLNGARKAVSVASHAPNKIEPVIFAPSPIPVTLANVKSKRKENVVDITTPEGITNNEFFSNINQISSDYSRPGELHEAHYESPALIFSGFEDNFKNSPPDDISPELEFLRQPLPDIPSDQQSDACRAQINGDATKPTTTKGNLSTESANLDTGTPIGDEDKSDTSSQYSKSSSTNSSANQIAVLEEKLRDQNERYALLETRVAQLSLENRQLVRRLTKHFSESGIDPSSSFATNFLITIPTVKLIKSKHGASTYYVYEVHITMRQRLEHWSVLRRYQEFYKLHKSLLRTHPTISSIDFPPKKHFGNKNSVFVDERRQQLQIYLLNLVESLPQLEVCKTKDELQKVFPFLRER